MEYAHQGIEIKTIPGVPPLQRKEPLIAANTTTKKSEPLPERPPTLTRRAADILVRVERLMDDATRALPPVAPAAAAGPAVPRSSSIEVPDTLASAGRYPNNATLN
jgi:penicillin-binding protein 1A